MRSPAWKKRLLLTVGAVVLLAAPAVAQDGAPDSASPEASASADDTAALAVDEEHVIELVELIAEPRAGLCGLAPGHDLGRDDSCAVVSGDLARARPVRAYRQWFGTPPAGTDSGLEVLPAPTPP